MIINPEDKDFYDKLFDITFAQCLPCDQVYADYAQEAMDIYADYAEDKWPGLFLEPEDENEDTIYVGNHCLPIDFVYIKEVEHGEGHEERED